MNISPKSPGPSKRNALPYILGGCALLSLCLLFACTANAAYWMLHQGSVYSARQPITQAISPEQEVSSINNGNAGEKIFYGEGTCSACHSLEPDKQIVGPSLSGVADRAEALAPDYTVESYLYESITDPNAYIAGGFQRDIMPANYGDRLSQQQLAELVAFLSVK
jgi:cytochrome c551/c552